MDKSGIDKKVEDNENNKISEEYKKKRVKENKERQYYKNAKDYDNFLNSIYKDKIEKISIIEPIALMSCTGCYTI